MTVERAVLTFLRLEMKQHEKPVFRSTTIVAVRRDGRAAMAGDGQVSLGETVMKGHARKVRRIAEGKIVQHWMSFDRMALMEQLGVAPT